MRAVYLACAGMNRLSVPKGEAAIDPGEVGPAARRPHRTFISLISLPDSGHTSRPRRLAASRQQTLLRSASLVFRLMNECSTCISNLMRDALSRFDLLAREARRRRSYKAGERDGERALRAVADTLRDLADADLAPPE